LSVAKNKLIWGALAGLLVNFSGIDLPDSLDTVAAGMSGCVTPLAFILLGASFSLNAATKNIKAISIVTACKLVIYPLLFMILPIWWGWKGHVIGAMLLSSGAPTAISSFPMAKGMGCDGELAGEIVVVTSVFSVLTMFLWIFGLKQFGLL
ncbi:MAG: AEC family transporter, partial [Firmicutes bacterium]|nr:AEC family transporter [Bacillota bacterium]